MKLSVEIPDENAVQLRTVADRLGVGLEQLARAAIVDLAAQQAADFENATSRVLSKNKELYRRLSQQDLQNPGDGGRSPWIDGARDRDE